MTLTFRNVWLCQRSMRPGHSCMNDGFVVVIRQYNITWSRQYFSNLLTILCLGILLVILVRRQWEAYQYFMVSCQVLMYKSCYIQAGWWHIFYNMDWYPWLLRLDSGVNDPSISYLFCLNWGKHFKLKVHNTSNSYNFNKRQMLSIYIFKCSFNLHLFWFCFVF